MPIPGPVPPNAEGCVHTHYEPNDWPSGGDHKAREQLGIDFYVIGPCHVWKVIPGKQPGAWRSFPLPIPPKKAWPDANIPCECEP